MPRFQFNRKKNKDKVSAPDPQRGQLQGNSGSGEYQSTPSSSIIESVKRRLLPTSISTSRPRTPNPDNASSISLPPPPSQLSPPAHDQPRPVSASHKPTASISLPAPKLPASNSVGTGPVAATGDTPPETDAIYPPEKKDELGDSGDELAAVDTAKDLVTADQTIHSLWRKIIEKLPEEEAKEIQQLVSAWESTHPINTNMPNTPDSVVLEELLNIAQRKRQESEERRWGFAVVNGKKVVLRAMLEKIIDFANKFREIGSIVMQYDPGHAALPWAGFVLILQFATSDQEILAHILSGLEDIAGIIADNAFYEGLYLGPENRTLFSDSTLQRFRKSLGDLHESIISYLVDTILITRQSTIRRFTTAPWKVGKLASRMADVIRSKSIMKERVKSLEAEANNNTNKRMVDKLEELETRLSLVLHRRLLRYDEKLNGMLESVEVNKRRDILTWLSVIDYPNHHALAQKGHVAGTGEWILDHEEFLRWRESSGSACLWIKGNAGTGKTKIATHVIQNLINDRERSINSEGFAYFYCNRDDPERRKPEVVISTLVKQLASLEQQGPLHNIIIKEHTRRMLNTGKPSPLNFGDGQNLIKELCDTYPRSWIFIDALDECDPETRYELLHALQDLSENCSSLLKVFITSRLDEDITAVFNPKCIPTILLESTRSGTDIRKIAEYKVNEAITKRGLLGGKLKSEQLTEFKLEMTHILVEGAQGMPLWITYQIESVCRPNRTKYQKPEQVLAALKAFPTGLTNTYDFILRDILAEPHDECNAVAITAFRWVMAAARPMKPEELLGAIDPHAESDSHPELESVLELCKHLLVHDKAGDVIRFYHLSVREYLETRTTCGDLFNMDVARGLLIEPGLLLLAQVDYWDEGKNGFRSTVKDITHPQTGAYLRYTAWNWPAHVAKDTKSEGMIKLLRNHVALREWFLSCIKFEDGYNYHINPGNQLSFASSDADRIFGYECHRATSLAILRHSLATTGTASLPLRVVAYCGLYELAKVLVDNGGSPEDPTALEIAVTYGNEAVVRYLVENGAKADNSRAVSNASGRGHEQIVRYLVENGAKAENPKAVTWAASNGHEKIVRYLVENGAKADNSEAISSAAFNGHEQIVRHLVENGAKADNSQAISYAARGGHEQIVSYLVENGAKADNPEAVSAAVPHGHEKIVRYLVENGAKADNSEAVSGAAFHGHEQIVRYLVENGAKADNSQAISYAALNGHEQIVRCLVENGAKADNSEAVTHAASNGHEQIVRYLVENGAEADNPQVLTLAAAGGHEQIVRYLVENGAKADNSQAVLCAAFHGHEQIVRYLVENGAKADNSEAVSDAAFNGHEQIVRYLVENGAKADNSRAVSDASSRGHEQIVRCLVENGAKADNPEVVTLAASGGHEQIVRCLVENGAKADNSQAVLCAAFHGHEQIVRYLVENGAKADNSTAISHASMRGYEQIVRYLVENGAKADNSKAVSDAALNGHEQIVRYLVENGAKADNPRGVIHAASRGHEQIVRYLVENGANPENPGAVQEATLYGYERIVQYLQEQADIRRKRLVNTNTSVSNAKEEK